MIDDPIPLRSALDAVADDLRSGSASVVAVVVSQWQTIVGDQLVAHTAPGSMIDGVLTIHASDSAAASVVRQRSASIGARYAEVTGKPLRQLRVVVSRDRSETS